MPSEDGNVYRWDLATDSLSQTINVGTGIGEAYVPTIINPNNGQILTINNAKLFAIGSVSGVGIDLTSSTPSNDTVVTGQTLTFTATISDVNHTGHTPTGTVTFVDTLDNATTFPVTTLAASVARMPADKRPTQLLRWCRAITSSRSTTAAIPTSAAAKSS